MGCGKSKEEQPQQGGPFSPPQQQQQQQQQKQQQAAPAQPPQRPTVSVARTGWSWQPLSHGIPGTSVKTENQTLTVSCRFATFALRTREAFTPANNKCSFRLVQCNDSRLLVGVHPINEPNTSKVSDMSLMQEEGRKILQKGIHFSGDGETIYCPLVNDQPAFARGSTDKGDCKFKAGDTVVISQDFAARTITFEVKNKKRVFTDSGGRFPEGSLAPCVTFVKYPQTPAIWELVPQ